MMMSTVMKTTIMKKTKKINMMKTMTAVMRVMLTVMKTTMMKMKKKMNTMKIMIVVMRVLLTVMKAMIERGHVQCIHTWLYNMCYCCSVVM